MFQLPKVKILKGILKTLKWVLLGLIGLIVLVVVLIYLPPVQDLAVGQVLKSLNKNPAMQLGVKKLRLYFPLDVKADSLSLEMDGMDISADKADVSVSMRALFAGRIVVDNLAVKEAKVNMGTPDSTLYMRLRLQQASLSNTAIGLSAQTLDLDRLEASGGNMALVLKTDTVAKPSTPSSADVRWLIKLRQGELKDISYRMQYLPVIDSIDCHVALAQVDQAEVSLERNTVKAKAIEIKKVNAKYLTPSAQYLAEHPLETLPPTPIDTVPYVPWTVTVDKVRLSQGEALYATAGVVPVSPNFDPVYIQASDIAIEVDSFRNRGVEVRVPIKRISARERSGIPATLTGLFDMDSTEMRASDMALVTPTSRVTLDATLGLLDSIDRAPMEVDLNANIGPDDLRRLVPPALEPMVKGLPPYSPLLASIDVAGTMADIDLRSFLVELPSYVKLEAKGKMRNPTDLNLASGNFTINGQMRNGAFLKPMLLDSKMQKEINLPPLTIAGGANLSRGQIDGKLKVATAAGKALLDAKWNNRSEAFDVHLRADSFPVQSFMPALGVRNLTAEVSAQGRSLDFTNPKADLKADINLRSVTYNGRHLQNASLSADLQNGHADIQAQSRNHEADFTLRADGNLAGVPYAWNFDGDIQRLDLHALGLMDSLCAGTVKLQGNAYFSPAVAKTRRNPAAGMSAGGDIRVLNLNWVYGPEVIACEALRLQGLTNDSTTTAQLSSGDLMASFTSPASVDTLTAKFMAAMGVIDEAMHKRQFRVDSLHQTLPLFSLQIEAGTDNILSNYLTNMDIAFDTLSIAAQNAAEISARAKAINIQAKKTLIDTLSAELLQDGDLLAYQIAMNNAPGTMDEFATVVAKGTISPQNLSLALNQKNVKGETGYSLGGIATMPDSTTIRLKFVPFHPIIGYKDWQLNRDNFLSFNFATKHFDANLDLHNTLSAIKIFTDHPKEGGMEHETGNRVDSINGSPSLAEAAPAVPQQEDVTVQLSNILLSDWIKLNPFAPEVTGSLSADMRLSIADKALNGQGRASLADFTYDRRRVGTFDLDLGLTTNASGTIRAGSSLKVDGREVMTAEGNLNDSTARSPFLLDMKVIRFPLAVANPFLPAGTASLRGTLSGRMDVTGETTSPVLNGSLRFDSTAVYVNMVGTAFDFSDIEIPVDSSVVRFNDFAIYGTNSSPLNINGYVDISKLANPKIDLSLNAQNLQVVNSKQRRGVDVYGKGFLNLSATAKGSMRYLEVKADVTLLNSSDVTYVVQDLQSAIASRSNQNLVKFVNFTDSTAVDQADTLALPSSMMALTANLSLQQGAVVNVDLSTNGRNKVQVEPSGKISYYLGPLGNETVNGRININDGFVRYTPPLMSEKIFNFSPNSYVTFNGDMMNPGLNVSATDVARVNVTGSGNSRMVDFDITVDVTGTLDQMNVAFDVAAPSDVTVENELQSMSQQQRASQAMNILLYGVYAGPGTNPSFSGNPLFSFLESQLNTWASSAIKGVDLTFGIDQFDKTVDGVKSTATSYSYQISKSLFDNRFKIVVGGNYTDDPQTNENFAQNLIADISFEYILNKSGSMYVRLFRHTGYESILEGEVTQTGVGFVYKKKIQRLGDIFWFLRRRHHKNSTGSENEKK